MTHRRTVSNLDERSVDELLAPPSRPAAGLIAGCVIAAIGAAADLGRAQAAPDPATSPRSLVLDAGLELGADGHFFKQGELLLWTDASSRSVALGAGALAASTADNQGQTAIGFGALAHSTGNSLNTLGNTAVGALALHANTTGAGNTAVGDRALDSNTTAALNTAVGVFALRENETGHFNSALGFDALRENLTGGFNTGVGWGALRGNTVGESNTAVGAISMAGAQGLFNTAIGSGAMASAQGSKNIAIGWNAGWDIQGSENIVIGEHAHSNVSHTIRIGVEYHPPSGTGQKSTIIAGIRDRTVLAGEAVYIDANGKLGSQMVSSRRAKEAIRDLAPTARRLHDLRPVAFRYREELAGPGSATEFGLIAEEVAEVFPELAVFDEEGRPAAVRYRLLAPLLLAELQRLERRQIDQRQSSRRAAAPGLAPF